MNGGSYHQMGDSDPEIVIYQEEIDTAAAKFFAAHPVPAQKLTVAYGEQTLPTMTKGAENTLSVALDGRMPHVDYTVKVRVVSGNVKVTGLQLTIGTRTRDAVSITVKAVATVPAGILFVDCYALA